MATEFDEIFSGNKPCHLRTIVQLTEKIKLNTVDMLMIPSLFTILKKKNGIELVLHEFNEMFLSLKLS
jgi:hypothetical protein